MSDCSDLKNTGYKYLKITSSDSIILKISKIYNVTQLIHKKHICTNHQIDWNKRFLEIRKASSKTNIGNRYENNV